MADSTYAVKVNDEVKQRIQKLVDESGLSSKELFMEMVSQFELVATKKQTPILAADIDEVVTLTTRINGVFNNIGERVASLQETHRLELEKEKKKNENLSSLLQKQIELTEQYKGYIEENEDLKKKLANAVQDAEKAARDIERQKEIFELEKSRALLEQREQHSKDLDEVRTKCQERISQILNLNNQPKEVIGSEQK